MNELYCPNCNCNSKLTIMNYQPLMLINKEKEAKENNYFLDNVLDVKIKCWDCGNEFKAMSKLNFEINPF